MKMIKLNSTVFRRMCCCAIVLTMLEISCPCAGGADLSPEEARQLHEAQQAINARHHDEAVKLLLRLRPKYPDDRDIPRLLTHAYFGLGDYKKARETALAAIHSGRLNSEMLGRLAQIDQKRDDRLALVNTVRLLTVVDADNQQWRLIYGDLLANSGALRESVTVYQSLIDAQPASADLHVRLGNVQLQDERFTEAVSTLETAWHLGSSDPRLPLSIASAWQRLDDDRRAVAWMERAASMGELAPSLTLQLGSQLFGLNELDRAEKHIGPLTKSSDPQVKSQAHLLLGQIAMQREEPDAAISQWRQAVDSGLDSPRLLKALGAHYYNAGEYKEAAAFLRRAVDAEDGTDEETLRFLVISLIRGNDLINAREYLRMYIEQNGLSDEAKQLVHSWTVGQVRPATSARDR